MSLPQFYKLAHEVRIVEDHIRKQYHISSVTFNESIFEVITMQLRGISTWMRVLLIDCLSIPIVHTLFFFNKSPPLVELSILLLHYYDKSRRAHTLFFRLKKWRRFCFMVHHNCYFNYKTLFKGDQLKITQDICKLNTRSYTKL